MAVAENISCYGYGFPHYPLDRILPAIELGFYILDDNTFGSFQIFHVSSLRSSVVTVTLGIGYGLIAIIRLSLSKGVLKPCKCAETARFAALGFSCYIENLKWFLTVKSAKIEQTVYGNNKRNRSYIHTRKRNI